MSNRLYVTPYRCIDCKICEQACSLEKASVPGVPAKPRVQSFSITEKMKFVSLCLQCDQASCQAVCPVYALVRNPETGAIEVNDRCIGCGFCVPACPFGCMDYDPVHNEYIKCDVCKGDPACAKYCPTGALVWSEKPWSDQKADDYATKKSTDPFTIALEMTKK
jgi:anaerobic carbon-monoxide dehydrogenase iron sulfur subunit